MAESSEHRPGNGIRRIDRLRFGPFHCGRKKSWKRTTLSAGEEFSKVDAMLMRSFRFVAALLITGSLVACTPMATYPRVEGAKEFSGPMYEPVPGLMTASIRWAHATYGGDRAYAINLPEGSPSRLYDVVIRRLGAGKPQHSPDEWTYHIKQVRGRGMNGEVDLLVPKPSGGYEFLTVHLRGAIDGWSVTSTRTWRIPFEVPAPNWTAPEPPAPDTTDGG